jgi:hypothetical protein
VRTSDQIDQLIPALVKARAAFPPIMKNQVVTVHGERGSYDFEYADLASLLQAVAGPLSAEGLVLLSGLEDAADGGVRVVTRIYHVSGQWLEAAVGLAKPKSMQALGSALTYTRRYSLQALLGIAAEDDDDGSAASGQTIVPRTKDQANVPDFPSPTPNGQESPTTIPAEARLPCGGQGIAQLKPAQLAMLIGKVARFAEEKGGRWQALLGALQAERGRRLARGRRPLAVVPSPDGGLDQN